MPKSQLPSDYRNIPKLQRRLHTEAEKNWQKKGQKRALRLFREMSKRVPAYKDFLQSHNFSASQIRDHRDFHKIPAIDKDNYLRKYPKEMLAWDGEFPRGQWVISTTSGSTGKPYYFPRQADQDLQYAVSAELYLRNNFQIHKRSTLYIVAFPMGAWIGGVFTYEALKIIADKGEYDLSIITPGIHKQEVINAVLQLGEFYDQIIIGAYAPFLKDILDDGTQQGIDWKKYKTGFIFSAEAFSETFRDYVLDVTKPDSMLLASLNHYGTVDLGTMAHETPESIMIRRELVSQNKLQLLFPEAKRQPTFCQYDPSLFYFEEEQGNLLCSANSGLPLFRYDLKDYGGVISRSKVHESLGNAWMNMSDLIDNNGLKSHTVNLPFVYIYERNDFSVSYYAFLIYPDMVRRALQDERFRKLLTGKFTMLVDYDKTGRQKLLIHVEKKFNVTGTDLTNIVTNVIHNQLLEESSEYNETFKVVGKPAMPVVTLWDYESSEYFKPGVKQKWVSKQA